MPAEGRTPLPLRGVIPPMVTPLLPDGRPDLDSLDRLVDHLIDTGVTGLLVLGSTGEAGMLTDESRAAVLERAVKSTAGRVHVMAGLAALGTEEAADQACRWAWLGADSVLCPAPYAVALTAPELRRHFQIVAAAAPVPVVAYNVPVRVQVVLDPELLVSLAEEGTIAGVKDSSGDQQRARTLAEVSSGLPEFRRYTGSEHCMDACLLWGFHAVVPGLANPLSRFHVRLTDAASEGDWPGAAQLQGQIVRLLELYAYALPEASYTASAIAAMKEALVQQGVIAHATASRPFAPADEGLRDHVARILKWARVLDGQ